MYRPSRVSFTTTTPLNSLILRFRATGLSKTALLCKPSSLKMIMTQAGMKTSHPIEVTLPTVEDMLLLWYSSHVSWPAPYLFRFDT